MSLQTIITSTLLYLSKLSKKKLIGIIDSLRKSYLDLELENEALKSEIAKLKKAELSKKVKKVNKESNRPSSKQADWELKGVGNDGLNKKKGRGKKGRKGSGNQSKTKAITKTEKALLDYCTNCGNALITTAALSSVNTRIVEDIVSLPLETEVVKVIQQKKYCSACKTVQTARSENALSGTDIGINTSIQLVYQWIALGLTTTRIALCLKEVFGQSLSTAGISAHLIKVGGILEKVQENILQELKKTSVIHADETGWRVAGKLWWMWVVGNKSWAYYTIDNSRGKDVVRRMLGEFFLGVLVVDGWRAYLSVECEQQSCMSHLLRKIRKLYAAFPNLRSVFKFYIKFRKILRDGERLQAKREELGEIVFERRLQKLHVRLEKLLNWANPNDILKEIIKKVENQRERILTFVEHPDVPCHNNYAEYLIRIGVLKRKVSFGSKSAEGAQAYATLLTVYTTCKLQGIPFLDFLEKSLKNYTQKGEPLLIGQYLKLCQNKVNKAA